MLDELRQLIDEHVLGPKVPFTITHTGLGAYDAIFDSDELPSIDDIALRERLRTNVPAGMQTLDEKWFLAQSFEGEYQGQPIVLRLRARTISREKRKTVPLGR